MSAPFLSAHQSENIDHVQEAYPEHLRNDAIEKSHVQGHFGVKATVARLIADHIVWPSMRRDVEEFIRALVHWS